MTGINKQTLYNWSDDKLTSVSFDLQEKIMEDNEDSLFSLMKDRRMNPMKLLPKLNKVHGWNMPGVRQDSGGNKALGLEEIKNQLKELSENGTQLAITDGKNSC